MNWEGIISDLVIGILGITGTLLTLWFKAYLAERKKRTIDVVKEDIEITGHINTILDNLKEEMKADRSYIFQFHNGVTYYTGNHQQRFSCTFERVSDGISPELRNLQNLIISAFGWFLEILAKNCIVEIPEVKKCEDNATRAILEGQGIQSCYARMISDNQNHFIAFVGVDYVREETKLKDSELVKLERYADKLQGYLLRR